MVRNSLLKEGTVLFIQFLKKPRCNFVLLNGKQKVTDMWQETIKVSDMVMTLSNKCVTLPWVTHINQGLTPVPTQLLVVPDIEVSVGLVSLV